MRPIVIAWAVLSASGCGDGSSAPAGDTAAGDTGNPACEGSGPLAVGLTTDDGLELRADLWPAGATGGPAAVLLHMNPVGNDASNFPPAFIEALTARTITVLNVNRRGAAGSEGDPTTAFEGPNGRLDAKAAVEFLASHCSKNPAAVVLVGASNGTTTAVDFTVAAASDPAQPPPRGLVFLSPGEYTENQNALADHAALFAGLPILLAYPDSEAAWAEGVRPLDTAGRWTFTEHAGGAHGTGLFQSNPESVEQTADFVGMVLDVGQGW